jgi:spore maturation protein CgeB
MKKYACQLFTAQTGESSARLEDENGNTIHLHSLVDPRLESRYFQDLNIWGDRIILLGTGLGYHVSQLLHRIPSDSQIIVIEYYQELAEICIKERFSKQPVFITSQSSDPVSILRNFIDGGRYVQVIKHPVAYRVQQLFYDKLLQETLYSKTVSKERTSLLLYGNFFLQEELRSAMNNCGNAAVFDYRKFSDCLHYHCDLEESLQKLRPEMIISVNMMGFDGSGVLSDLSFKYGIPVSVWFVDDPTPILLHQNQFIKSNMTAFCWEKTYLNGLRKAGFKDAHYLPLATSPELFSRKPASPGTVKLAFVGSAMNGEFLENIRRKIIWNPSYDSIVKQSAEIISECNRCNVADIISQVSRKLNISLPDDTRNVVWLQALIIHTASMLKRKRVINSVKDLGIETFGDPQGWRQLCGSWIKTHHDIDYRTELASVFRKIEINLNITSSQMPTGVNQRVFDIPASGSFVLNDKQSDLEELFEKDEVVTYCSIDELKEKIRYYSNNESARRRISENALFHIMKEHTYLNRYKKMCTLINK